MLPPIDFLHLHCDLFALAQQRLRSAQHQQAGHQIFEHRAVPGNQCQTAVIAHDRAAEMEPVLHRYILVGNGEIAGQPRFAGEQVIMVGIHPVCADIIANVKQPALAVIIGRKFHLPDIFLGPFCHFPEIAR